MLGRPGGKAGGAGQETARLIFPLVPEERSVALVTGP